MYTCLLFTGTQPDPATSPTLSALPHHAVIAASSSYENLYLCYYPVFHAWPALLALPPFSAPLILFDFLLLDSSITSAVSYDSSLHALDSSLSLRGSFRTHCELIPQPKPTRPPPHINSASSAMSVVFAKIFVHTSLDHPDRQIRLLKVIRRPGRLRFELVKVFRDEAPQFAAISYVWGTEEATKHISIDGKAYNIRPNCHYALEQAVRFRCSGADRRRDRWDYLWIDAICINQEDAEEKSHQVSMMSYTYDAATVVLASLGAHANGSQRLFRTVGYSGSRFRLDSLRTKRLLREVASPGNDSRVAQQNTMRHRIPPGSRSWSKHFQSMDSFIKRDYWTRLWIIQEVYGRENVFFMCGQHTSPMLIWLTYVKHLYGSETNDPIYKLVGSGGLAR